MNNSTQNGIVCTGDSKIPCANGFENPHGVVITKEQKEHSDGLKGKKPKTIRQLPVFCSASNLSFVISQMLGNCPRKYRLIVEGLEALSDYLLVDLDLANEDKDNRGYHCTEAHSKLVAILVKVEILKKVGGMSKDDFNKVSALCRSTLAQVVGWRSSVLPSGL